MKGDVESVASKTPKELMQFIEQISGSDEFREAYEEAKKAKEEAEENTIFTMQKRKGYAAEKKQVREQKEEAERFNDKITKLEDLKREFFLWQLFHIHKVLGSFSSVPEEVLRSRLQRVMRKTELLLLTPKYSKGYDRTPRNYRRAGRLQR